MRPTHLVLLLAVLTGTPGGGASAHAREAGSASARVAVLLSQDAPQYREFVTGFKSALDKQRVAAAVTVRRLDANAARTRAAVRESAAAADLLVPLGSAALRAVIDERPALPAVASMVPRESDLAGAQNTTGVVLEFTPEVEFQWLRRILPDARRVGVLYNTAENQLRIIEATAAAGSSAFELHTLPVAEPRDLPDALEAIAGKAQVLWGITDRVVMTPETAKPILLFLLRHRIPLVGPSAPWVKAGTLYALDRDYADLGRQAAELAARVLKGQSPGSLRPLRPRKALLAINRRTAAALDLDLPPDVLRQANVLLD